MEQPVTPRSNRALRKLPVQDLGAPGTPNFLGVSDARPSLHNQLHNLGENLQEASFMNQMIQDQAESSCGAPAWKGHRSLRRSLSAPPPLRHFAFEEQSRQKLQKHVPPSPLHDVVVQLRAAVESLQKVVGHLAELASGKNKNNTNTTNTINNNNDNNSSNNDKSNNDNNNNHNIIIRASSLNNLDLEDEHPESSSEQDLDDQKLEEEQKRDSFGQPKPKKKKVTFNQDTLEACQDRKQNNRYHSSQLEQLSREASKTTMTKAQARSSNSLQQL